MAKSMEPATKEPKITMTSEQRKAEKAELHRLIMKGIREMGPETLAKKRS
jgi:hypothetical protein